ncbi:hypothetical protein E2P81_ATG10605 [Venturia nashicola]|nr:hypothetical protein E2P81_ATG10605 [Venturia nashicola]
MDNASQFCRARDRWFGDAKWASVLGASDMNEPDGHRDGEVVYLDNASFRDLVDEQTLLEKPIVVQERQHDFEMYDVEVVREELRDSHGNENVTSTNALSDVPTFVAMEDFLVRFSGNEWSLGSYTTYDFLEAQRPAFLNHYRFRLLHKAVSRASSQSNKLSGGGLGCGDTAHSLCVNKGLSFNRIECSGAFSGPYLDPLGGTWIRNLEGQRLCAFVSLEQLTSSLFDESIRNDAEWWPRGSQRLVLLEPGDVLILPPNVVCAQLAVDAGISLQGSFWDESDWRRCFAATAWAAANRTHVTPQIPRCATRLALHGLKSLAAVNPQRFASDGFAKDYLEIDLAGVYKTVMAEGCVKEESAIDGNVCHSQAQDMSGRRRTSSSQAGFGQPSKRLCIR